MNYQVKYKQTEEIKTEDFKPVVEPEQSDLRYIHWRDMELSPKFSFAQNIRFDNYSIDELTAFINNLIKCTNQGKYGKYDHFWETAETAFLQACFFYLHFECAPEDQNLANIMKLLRFAIALEGQEKELSSLDVMFEDLKAKDPEYIGVLSYAIFRSGCGTKDVTRLILASCVIRLVSFFEQY